MHMQYPQRPEDGTGSFGAGIIYSCKQPYGCWEPNLGPLQEQEVLLTTELQLLNDPKLLKRVNGAMAICQCAAAECKVSERHRRVDSAVFHGHTSERPVLCTILKCRQGLLGLNHMAFRSSHTMGTRLTEPTVFIELPTGSSSFLSPRDIEEPGTTPAQPVFLAHWVDIHGWPQFCLLFDASLPLDCGR